MRKINLGCGNDLKEGFENYDKFPVNDSVKYINLDSLPLPFNDNSIDYIIMKDTFEHLDVNRYDFMMDIYRILKKGGTIEIDVPTNCDSVSHTIPSFERNYFDILKGGRKCVNENYYGSVFSGVEVIKCRRRFLSLYYKFRNFLDRFYYCKFVFKLKK